VVQKVREKLAENHKALESLQAQLAKIQQL
jgi:hypothetical protein